MIKNITYEDKASIQNDESVARKNKVTDADMNEIKEVVNANADGQITMQKDITNIKAKDTEQDKYIAELEAENTRLREDLNGLPKGQASGESIDLSDSAEMRCDLKISGNSVQDGEPTPDTPVEVESCGDNVNLFDGIFREGTNTVASSNKTLAFSQNNVKCKINKIYTFSSNLDLSIYNYALMTNTNNFPTENSVTDNTSWKSTKTLAITSTINGYLGIHIKRIDGNEISIEELNNLKYKIVEGTNTGEYSPYGQGCINEVICNKNLLDKNLLVLNKWINGDNGTIMTSTSGNYYATEKYIPFNQYVGKTIISSETMVIAFYDSNKTFISINSSTNPRQVVVPSKTEYIRVEVRKDYYEVAQLALGSSATPYEEHKSQTYTIPTQQPIRSIEIAKNTFLRDTFIKKNNKWYERHYIARKIFDGTNATWKAWTGNPPTGYSVFYTATLKNIIDANIPCKSNMLPYKTSSWNSGINAISIHPAFKEIYVSIESIHASTVDELNEFLANNNLVVDYISKEPIDIECTEEQSTILFDIEQNAKTYDKVTHMYSTDKISSYKEVTYKKDIETLFENTLVEGV